MSNRYRKKPVEVTAELYRLGLEDGFASTTLNDAHWSVAIRPFIDTPEGKMFISEGDYIITGIHGERYPCKPDIFEKTYEKI